MPDRFGWLMRVDGGAFAPVSLDTRGIYPKRKVGAPAALPQE